MRVDDLVVEVRDRDLQRVGQIDAQFLTGAVFSPRPNGAGSWQVKLPASVAGVQYTLGAALREPGAGIIVTGPHGVIISGPTVAPVSESDATDVDGRWTISGTSDAVLLQDALAFPDPASADPAAQTQANDVRTSQAENLLRQYVSANIANTAPAGRRRGFRTALQLGGVSLNRGPVGTKSPRFQNLLELCQEIVAGTNLLFDVVQVDDHLEFVVWEAADLRASHRMDVENDQLRSTTYSFTLPALTVAIVAGQGEGTERTMVTRTLAATAAAEVAWGRPIEAFIDQRQTDDLAELQQKGDADLLAAVDATDSLTVVPSDDLAAAFGDEWTVGALVTVVVGDTEIPARINQAVVAVTTDGVLLGCVIGDADGGDWEGQVNRSLSGLGSRVSSLERNTLALSTVANAGTTAERNLLFPTPSGAAAQAAMANRRLAWFNTELGWAESYYAPTGTSGLTVQGLVAGSAAGWYPTGRGPKARLVCGGQQSLSTGAVFTAWAALGSATIGSWRRGGAAFIVHDLPGGYLQAVKAGRYRIRCLLPVQAGSSAGRLFLSRNASVTNADVLAADAVTLSASFPMNFRLEVDDTLCPAGDFFRVYAGSIGTAVFGQGADGGNPVAGEFVMEYLGPPLVSA